MKKLFYSKEILEASISVFDFYEKVGIVTKNSSGEKICMITDVQQISMNHDDCVSILDFAKKNKKKNPDAKGLTDREFESRLSFEWGCYSPRCRKEIPKGEIWIDA